MKISDITDETIKAHCGITEAPNGLLEVYKSAAIAEICGFTGLTTEELDALDDVAYAFLAIVCEMFTTREMTVEIDKLNPMAMQILSAHRRNFL